MYVKGLFDKKPPSTRQALSPLTCTKESNKSRKIQFAIPSAHYLDETQLDETCPNCSGDHYENQVDEYSDGSDSSDSEMDIDDEIENDLTFLRTTRSGRSITINRSLF